MTAATRRVGLAPGVLFRDLGDESVLLNLDNDRYYGLDDVGTRMWQLLAELGAVDAVVARLLEEYAGQVDEPTLRRDLEELIATLVAAGLVTVEAGEP
jgi:hypothetical protein